MRSLIFVFVFSVFGCVERGASDVVAGEESEVEVLCRHPRGDVVLYRVEGVKYLNGLTKTRSGLWYFRGERVRDGKLVDVVANDCYVEREVGSEGV